MNFNKESVIVVGGGIAGLSAATAVAEIGPDVILVERDMRLGGHAADWACMATVECAKCSACLVQDQVFKALCHPRIQIILGAEIASFRGEIGNYQILLEPTRKEEPGQTPWTNHMLRSELEVTGSCVILATGFDEYDAKKNPLLGYGQIEGVVTTRDLDKILREDDLDSFLPEQTEPLHIAFIQCVGSRDRTSGLEYCSQFCCRTTIRLARRLLYLAPEVRITVFYIDLQVMSKDFLTFYQQARESIRFIQGVPAEVTPGDVRPLRLFSTPPGSDRVAALEFDRVVLAIGMSPSESQSHTADLFDIDLNEFGYFAATDRQRSNATNKSGVFPVGGCAGPADIQGSRKQALAAATRVVTLMKARSVQTKSTQDSTNMRVAAAT